MFTGIIETTGRVVSLIQNDSGVWRLWVDAKKIADTVAIGDSVANNGCCLTVVAIEGTKLAFDVLDETLKKTSFSLLKKNSLLNLERSLPVNGRMGGHFVSGHVDACGKINLLRQDGNNFHLQVNAPKDFLKYLVYKGSIAIDGISLTVASVDDINSSFDIWLIPHTMAETNLHERKAGDPINLEFDILAKYVERISGYTEENKTK